MIKRNHTAVGIDLSDKTANFCAMSADTGVLEEGRFALTPASFVELWQRFSEADVFVLEAGTPSAWVHELLKTLGAHVIVADPRKLKAVTESVRKSDVRDARMLARLGLADEELLAPTYVRPPELRNAMALLKVRDQQVRARTSTILEIRSQVKLVGQRMPKCDAAQFHRHEDAVPPELRDVLAPLFLTLRGLAEAIENLDAQIAERSKSFPIVAELTKVDGVGPITALAFVVVVGDPWRFHRTRDIAAYLGLVPRRDQSGIADPSRRISKAGCGMLRRLLTQCAQAVCRPVGRDTALRRKAHAQIAARGKTNKRKVIVAVARKLSVLLLSLWKSGERYVPLHRVPAVAADAPEPVVLDECGEVSCASERDTESAPSTSTRTPTCTGDQIPTTSADGSAGRPGASTRQSPTRRRTKHARASAPAPTRTTDPTGSVPCD
jgi:transposase